MMRPISEDEIIRAAQNVHRERVELRALLCEVADSVVSSPMSGIGIAVLSPSLLAEIHRRVAEATS